MKKLFFLLTIALAASAPASGQTQQGGGGDAAAAAPRAARQRLIGEVTAVDAASRQLTVRADSGETATLTTTAQTTYVRMPPGETSLQKGQPAAFDDVRVGDRVLAPGVAAAGGEARQVILMARAAAAAGAGRDEGRRLNGRVVSVDAAKRLIVVQTRGGRGGQEAVTVDASGAARFLRFAPDSTRPADAQPGSFADVRAGDSLRATGERAADGATFKAEEVLSGAFARFAGTVTKVDAARGELTVANEQTGQTVTLALGARSSVRRVTPELEQVIAQRAERREQRRASGQQQGGGQGEGESGRRGGGRRDGEGRRRDGEGGQRAEGGERRGEGGERRGEGGQRRGGGGGQNFQQMMEGLPAVTLAELKKGDAVVATITPTADASRATVVSLLTGAAEVLRGMQQFQRGPEGQRGMSPGLPGDVIGGGQGPTREPPR